MMLGLIHRMANEREPLLNKAEMLASESRRLERADKLRC
jgi:hypothetical protein